MLTKRRRQLPSRFRVAGLQLHDKRLKDVLPQPVPALPPPGVDVAASTPLLPSTADPQPIVDANLPESQPPGATPRLHLFLETTRNSFGLFRRYFADKFPSHDPEGEVDKSDLSDVVDAQAVACPGPPDTPSSYGPYANKSSFLLGDWYWNHGVQKSQKNFKELVDIIGQADFQPAEIRTANWKKINSTLAINKCDQNEEWVDEEDAGWTKSDITIKVPFHRLTDSPGTREYTVANFHHRSLVSVIRDKITNEADNRHFHYEPYELLWRPADRPEGVRVHGELYASPAFMDAHNAVQNAPPEPDCTLPRVVVALMFWSDATHLTNFGNAKLWPLYMFFGNDSKYRRCTPSFNTCEHVAYFETVCISSFNLCQLRYPLTVRLVT
jgi:hypothetical protein